MFTTIELFAGAAGLALGIEKAGFKTLALNEFNADACATLRKNRPNWNVIEGDVAEISGLDLEEYFSVRKGELDLLSGGAPCQAFPMPVKTWIGRCKRNVILSLCNVFGKTTAQDVFI